MSFVDKLPPESTVLKLYKIDRNDRLIPCEAVLFKGGRGAVDTVLRRAAIAGHVEIGGDIKDHFADVMDINGSIVETVALDSDSYGSLKNKWMRCKLEQTVGT